MFNTVINIAYIFIFAGTGVLLDKLFRREKNQTLTG